MLLQRVTVLLLFASMISRNSYKFVEDCISFSAQEGVCTCEGCGLYKECFNGDPGTEHEKTTYCTECWEEWFSVADDRILVPPGKLYPMTLHGKQVERLEIP